MPASQLKRLKASLRDQGVTGPQKSKKQKKQAAAGRTASDRVQRNAALQQIRDSFNPFELKAVNARPDKFASVSAKSATQNGGSGRYKQVLHRPGVSKSAGEEMRRATLLPELRRRNKVGGLVDRRIGEGDVDMTPEERAVQRFAREKERKAKSKSLFDLEGSDGEDVAFGRALTHGGRRIDDLAPDDFDNVSAEEESDDDGDLLRRKRRRSEEDEEDEENDIPDDGAQPPERKKTKNEVMQEVIAKSKLHKYERQKVKEDDDDLRMELDQGFDEILGLLQGGSKPPPKRAEPSAANGNGPVVNPDRQRLLDGLDRDQVDKEYDVRLKQMATEARAKPAERSKTAEEKARDEAERLRILEEKRQKRMRGEDVSEDEAGVEGGAEEGEDDEIPDEAADFGFTSSNAQPKQRDEQLVLEDEDEFALDDDLVADDPQAEDVDDVEDVELSENDSDADKSDEEGQKNVVEDEEDEFITDILGTEAHGTSANATAIGERTSAGTSYTYPCPRSHDELLSVLAAQSVDQLTTTIQRIRALYHPSLSSSNKESMADFSGSLVDHLKHMGDESQPLTIIEQVIRHLHSLSRTYPTEIGNRFRHRLATLQPHGQPTPGDLVILTAIGSIFPTSDHWHQVITPAITVMCRWLGSNAPTYTKPLGISTANNGALLTALCIQYQRLSKRFVPEALRFTQRVLVDSTLEKANRTPHLANLVAMADLWKEKTAFVELFKPVLAPLKAVGAKKEHQHISILLQQSRLRRRPLELHHHRKLAIRTSVPKFEENYNPDKHYDPDKERSDANKLQKEYKRERKGALRELRKDASFISREQLKEKREKDAAHAARERRLIAEINAEEGREANLYAREKAKRTSKR